MNIIDEEQSLKINTKPKLELKSAFLGRDGSHKKVTSHPSILSCLFVYALKLYAPRFKDQRWVLPMLSFLLIEKITDSWIQEEHLLNLHTVAKSITISICWWCLRIYYFKQYVIRISVFSPVFVLYFNSIGWINIVANSEKQIISERWNKLRRQIR